MAGLSMIAISRSISRSFAQGAWILFYKEKCNFGRLRALHQWVTD